MTETNSCETFMVLFHLRSGEVIKTYYVEDFVYYLDNTGEVGSYTIQWAEGKKPKVFFVNPKHISAITYGEWPNSH